MILNFAFFLSSAGLLLVPVCVMDVTEHDSVSSRLRERYRMIIGEDAERARELRKQRKAADRTIAYNLLALFLWAYVMLYAVIQLKM